jgi:hypothetical protein
MTLDTEIANQPDPRIKLDSTRATRNTLVRPCAPRQGEFVLRRSKKVPGQPRNPKAYFGQYHELDEVSAVGVIC